LLNLWDKYAAMDFRTDITFRKKTLIKLLDAILKYEDDICKALYSDFRKCKFESVLSETSLVISELKNSIQNIRSRARPKMVFPNLLNFPATDFIYSEPYGKVLIISPWNYPFLLSMSPVIAAVSAGNSVVLKPSEHAPNTASMLELIISEVFDPTHVEVFHGGVEVSERLLRQRWDYIFFTGSTKVGKLVAKAAAESLTPTTLELGGKNPCIVDATANIALAAKRIVWGKFLNAGQTCIAPDYILVKREVKEKLLDSLKKEITAAYGEDPQKSADYPRIIHQNHFDRLFDLIDPSKVVAGGNHDRETLYLAPTIIDGPAPESVLMNEEIFGPILPVLSYHHDDELTREIGKHEKPLSLYVFTDSKSFAREIIRKFSFGGGCINDTMIHFSNKRMPFGGVGHSGMGRYHGKYGFDTFSHRKSVTKKATWLDIPLRYAPYDGKLKLIRNILKWF
jgi:aldehyde dehydrogenase (NAD+)